MKALPTDVTQQQRDALATGVSLVEHLDAMIHQIDHLKAMALASLSRLATRIAQDEGHLDHGELVHRAVEAEVAVATRTGQVATASAMAHADALLTHYPSTAQALGDAAVSLAHTRVIVDAGGIISELTARAAYEAEVLPLARTMSAQRLRAHAKRLAEHFADRHIDERHREARLGRRVRVFDLDDGMAKLVATIGAVEAYAIKDRLSRIARAARGEAQGMALGSGEIGPDKHVVGAGEGGAGDDDAGNDARTLEQIQADACIELLLEPHALPATGSKGSTSSTSGSTTAPIVGRVQISVPVLRLAGADTGADTGAGTGAGTGTDTGTGTGTNANANTGAVTTSEDAAPRTGPAELIGYGPIDTETARRVAGGVDAWERVLTHPVSGAVLAVDRYRPSETLRRLLGARDEHCRFPGCTRRLDHCDIDHTIPAAAGGPTSVENLGHLCRKHHTLKHFGFMGARGWRASQQPGGVYEWRSPAGRRYVETPSSRVRFRPVAIPSQNGDSPPATGEHAPPGTTEHPPSDRAEYAPPDRAEQSPPTAEQHPRPAAGEHSLPTAGEHPPSGRNERPSSDGGKRPPPERGEPPPPDGDELPPPY